MKNNKLFLSLLILFLLNSCSNIVDEIDTSKAEIKNLNLERIPSFNLNGYCYFNSRQIQDINTENVTVQESYCIRVFVHAIRRSDGSGGQSTESIIEALNYLSNDFHNISFIWDGGIHYINDSNHYNNNSSAIFNDNDINNLHNNGVDIYFFDDNSKYEIAAGQAKRNITALRIGSTFYNRPAARTSIISHEMGHIFNLYHTYGRVRFDCDNLYGNCLETGDKVCDTPPDPGISFENVNSVTCIWNENDIDCSNYPNPSFPSPDTRNIMALSNPNCIEYFTPGQDVRMRESIASSIGDTSTNLENAIVNCNYCNLHQVFNISNDLNDREPYITCQTNDCEKFYWDFDSQFNEIVEFEFQYEKRNEINGVIIYELIYSDIFDNQYPSFIQVGYYTYIIENTSVILQGNNGGRWRVRVKSDNSSEVCQWSRWVEHN